jgi:plastocyanin
MKPVSMNFLFLFLLAAPAFGSTPVEIRMKSLSFAPKVLELKPGQSVRWVNTALTDHSATSEDTPPAFDTGLVHPGNSSKAIVFEKAGRYAYHCSIHGKTMSGIINVEGSPSK